jgi:hypothetical protein
MRMRLAIEDINSHTCKLGNASEVSARLIRPISAGFGNSIIDSDFCSGIARSVSGGQQPNCRNSRMIVHLPSPSGITALCCRNHARERRPDWRIITANCLLMIALQVYWGFFDQTIRRDLFDFLKKIFESIENRARRIFRA